MLPIPEMETPITPRENFKRLLDARDHLYIPNSTTDTQIIFPRRFFDGPEDMFNGYDGFGVHWTFVPMVGASTPTPGMKAVSSIENWKRELKWPDASKTDIDSVKKQAETLSRNKMTGIHIGHGFFERLHHIFGFEDALVAFLCNRQEVHDIFKRLLELKIKFIDIMLDAGDGIFDYVVHSDDMGTQRSTFFSREIFEEFLLPYNKALFDYIHGKGLYVLWHSCGNNSNFIDYMVELKTDWWEAQQASNNITAISEKYAGKLAIQFPPDPDIVYASDATDDEVVREVHRYVDASLGYKNCIVTVAPIGKQAAEIMIPEFRKYSLEKYSRK